MASEALHPDDFMTTGEVARVMGLSPYMIRWFEGEGRGAAQRVTSSAVRNSGDALCAARFGRVSAVAV